MKTITAGSLLFSAAMAFGQAQYHMALDIGRMAKSMLYTGASGKCGTENDPGKAAGGYPVGPGFISFDAYQANLGPGDFVITQNNNDLMVVRVFDMSGNQKTISQKDQFCPEDNGGAVTWINYNNPGLSSSCGRIDRGYMDAYDGEFSCNGANFGSLPTGTDYSIFAEMNPSRSWLAHSVGAVESDFDSYRVWLTGNYATSGSTKVFKVKTSATVGSKTLTSGKRVYYGVHTMNGTGTGKISISSGSNFTVNTGNSELGLWGHKIALTNQAGTKSTFLLAKGSKINMRVLGIEQF